MKWKDDEDQMRWATHSAIGFASREWIIIVLVLTLLFLFSVFLIQKKNLLQMTMHKYKKQQRRFNQWQVRKILELK